MKKLSTIIITIICIIFSATPTVYASDEIQYNNMEVDSYTEYYEDGSYTIITIKQSPSARASSYTKVGEKIVNLYNSNDELQWTYTLIGTFTVTSGVSAVCTNSTYSCEIYIDSWSLTAHNNYYSGNKAYGTATLKRKVLFITTNTHDIEGDIACDINGNIS